MVKIAWRPEFQVRGTTSAGGSTGCSRGQSTRLGYLDALESAIRDAGTGTVILRGNHADDRVALIVEALKRVDGTVKPIHAVGTVYSQDIVFGALAFLLTDIAETEEIGPTCVMRAISKHTHNGSVRPMVVVQYPQLLDVQTLSLLAQMAYSRSILLVILAAELEIMPTEFGPVSSGPGCREITVLPLSIGEAHSALMEEFSTTPTPVVTAELRQRSQGNPGLMLALAHDAVASGKLGGHAGFLVMNHGPWPYGGRVESVVMGQTSMLDVSERRFLHRLATAGTISISALTPQELMGIDRLMMAGFVEREGENRGRVTHSSKLLAEVFRNETHPGTPSTMQHEAPVDNGFYGFISAQSLTHRMLRESNNARSRKLHCLLENLRCRLLNGELDEAERSLKQITSEFIDELPAELFESVVIAEAILQVTSDCIQLAKPSLEALLAQVSVSETTYDHWLVKSMHAFIQENEDLSRHAPLPFNDQWELGRWWFTELISSGRTDSTSHDRGMAQPPARSRSELLMQIVELRNGLEPRGSVDRSAVMHNAVKIADAFSLIENTGSDQSEQFKLAGLESLVEEGFVAFALPHGNHILETLSDDGKTTVAAWIRRRRKGSSPRLNINSEELFEKSHPVLEVLTNREKMVATAAALGMNNQQIATDAGVSIRTVEGHLYQIYSKLALAGRRELSNLVESLRIDNGVKI